MDLGESWKDPKLRPFIIRLLNTVDNGGTISFYGCGTGNSRRLLQEIANAASHIDAIRASTKRVVWRWLIWNNEPNITFDVRITPQKTQEKQAR
jgi:hypothetical protein